MFKNTRSRRYLQQPPQQLAQSGHEQPSAQQGLSQHALLQQVADTGVARLVVGETANNATEAARAVIIFNINQLQKARTR